MEPEVKRTKTADSSFQYSGESDQATTIPEDVEALHCLSPLERIPSHLCNPRTQLKEVWFPEGLKVIGKKAFEGCTALQNIAMPVSLEEIGVDAFKDCTALTDAKLSEGIRVIGSGSFFQCSSLTRIKIPSTTTIIEENTFCGCSSLIDVDLGERVQMIRTDAFGKCTSLERMIVSSSVEVIEDGVFWECTALEDVRLFEGLKKLGKEVFRGCFSLKEISIPSTVETLEESTLGECTALAKVELKVGLKVIAENALGGCVSLTELTVPSTVEIIHKGAFWRCFALHDVTLQKGLKTISTFAFSGCKSIEEIFIPSTVESIEDDAFSQCEGLKNVHFHDGLTELINSFTGCNAIESVGLPSTMRVIGQSTFYGKANLVDIHLPFGLKAIKSGALGNCYSLKRIRVPSTVEEIAYAAFSGCSALTTIELSRDMVATIGLDAFRDCRSLINMAVPSSMTEPKDGNEYVDANCFGENHNCSQLIRNLGEDNLAQATTHRFDGFPVHAACYYSSTVEELREQINLSGWNEKKLLFDQHKELLVDPFGMTPFHVLALGVEPNPYLMEILLDTYPSYILQWRDGCGKRVTDYASWHYSSDAKSPLQLVLRRLMVDRVSDWGLSNWTSKMNDIVNDVVAVTDEADRDDGVVNAYHTLAKYERMASTSLLELRLWKMALNSIAATASPTDRSKRRIHCGAEILIPNVVTFLTDDIPGKDYRS